MALSAEAFHIFRPGPLLAEFVDFLWTYEGYVPPHDRERMLPTGSMELVFRLDTDGRLESGVAGARSEFLIVDTSRPFSIIAAHFKPGGGFPFFRLPISELRNSSVPLDLVWGRHAATLRDRLWEAETPERRFRILERALLDAAGDRLNRHPAVRHALQMFDRTNGARSVTEVVYSLGISSRRFVDVFRSEVGLSPKAFCRVRRFNEVLTYLERLTDVDWADVALSCGYFDQAHFNHDFRAFSGLSPTNYLRNRIARTHVGVIA